MLVLSDDIENWADSGNAPGEFPRLLACLIIGSCPGITDIAMPGGKGINCRGLDGRVGCSTGNAFVPGGSSLWELGTGADPGAKANADFKKRLDTVPMDERKDKTFVFATPRKWPNAQDWREEQCRLKYWRDVKVITSDQIEKWFEMAPWVANDFLREQLGRAGRGPASLWVTWRDYTNSCLGGGLNAQFVIAGRGEGARSVRGWLECSERGQPRALRMCGNSHVELRHFLAACVAEMPEAQREFHFQRIVLAEDGGSITALRGLHTDCVLVTPEGPHVATANEAVARSGCRIIVTCLGGTSGLLPAKPGYDVFELTAATNNGLIKSVVSCGYSADDATKLCKLCDFDYVKIRQEIFKC